MNKALVAACLLLILAGIAGLCALPGCDYTPPAKSKLDSAQTAVERTEKRRDPVKINRVISPDGTVQETELTGPVFELSQSATSRGASAESQGQKLTDNINTTAPTTAITPEGPSASGGDTSRQASAEGDKKLHARGCLIAGVLLCVLGFVGVWCRWLRAGAVLLGLGGVLIACGLWPVFMIWVLLGVIGIQAVLLLGFDRIAKFWNTNFRAHERAINDKPDDQKAEHRRRFEKFGGKASASLKARAKEGIAT